MIEALDRGDHAGEDQRYWVLDPIDGTKGFLRGDQYAVALALVDGGKVVVGVLGCPNLPAPTDVVSDSKGFLFSAAAVAAPLHDLLTARVRCRPGRQHHRPVTGGCSANRWKPPTRPTRSRPASPLVSGSPRPRFASTASASTRWSRAARPRSTCGCPATPATGRRSGTTPPARLVLEEAGGRVSDLDGQPLDFSKGRLLGNHRGIVCTNGAIHDQVLAACRAELGLD